MRLLRIVLIGSALAIGVQIAQTTPYLGLPFEPKPSRVECYDQAKWNGRAFVKTGRFLCLPE